MKYCSHCGIPIADDVLFCPNCGTSVTSDEPLASQEAPAAFRPAEEIPAATGADLYGTPQTDDLPEKPKKKRKLLITVLAVVLVLAIAAALYFFVFRDKPSQEKDEKSEAHSAAEKTMAQLEDALGNCENLEALCENLRTIAQSEQLTFRLGVELADSYDGTADTLDLSVSYDGKGRKLDGVLAMQGFELELYADEEELLVRYADFDERYFMVPLEHFGEAFADSALAAAIGAEDLNELRELGIRLFAPTDWDDFAEKNPDAAKFVESLEFVEVDESIPNAEGMTVYELSFTKEDIVDVYTSYLNYASGELLGAVPSEDELGDLFGGLDDDDEINVRIGVNDDGCLAAVHLFIEDEENGSFTVVLCGGDNLFEKIKVYENEERIYTLWLEKTNDGFILSGGRDEPTPLLICKDGDRELTVCDEDGEEVLTVCYGATKSGASFELSITEDDVYGDYETTSTVHITAEIVPFEGIETPDGEVVAIFELTQGEIQELAQRLMGYIYGDFGFLE